MVHIFLGRGFPRPPMMGPRPMRPLGFEPDFIPPFGLPRGRPRPNLISRPPMRPRALPPPRMVHPPLPPRPRHPPPRISPRDMPLPHIHPPGIIRPQIHPGPPMGMPIRPQPPFRGRGMFPKRGMPLKRLVPSNGVRVKKIQKRKEKTEDPFFCETCDRGWKTEEKLQEHLAQHEVCGRDGCSFTAHPKVVIKHIQIQHDSGLYNRINTEDAAKWIAERKSRFPTKENVEKKEARMNEMVKRGERIPNEGKRFQNNRTRENWRDKRKCTNEHSGNSGAVCKKVKENPKPMRLRKPCESSQWRDPDSWRGDLPQFPGTAAFPLQEDSSDKDKNEDKQFSDDDELTEGGNIANSVSQKPTVSNILTYLMVNYGSDMSDEDEDGETDLVSSKVENHNSVSNKVELDKKSIVQDKELSSKLIVQQDTQGEDPDSGPDEAIIEHEDKLNIPVLEGKENKDKVQFVKNDENKDRHKVAHVKAPMKRHQLSLLEKLLKNEIIHERNVILQCVRYVVQNNFLGCGSLSQHHTVDR